MQTEEQQTHRMTLKFTGICIFLFIVAILLLWDRGGKPKIKVSQKAEPSRGNSLATRQRPVDKDDKIFSLVRQEQENRLKSAYQVPKFLNGCPVEKVVLDPDSGAGWLKLKVPNIVEYDGNRAIFYCLCSWRVAPVIDGKTPLISDDFQKFADCWYHNESNNQTHIFRIFVSADITKLTTLEICPEEDSVRRRLKITNQNRLYLEPYH